MCFCVDIIVYYFASGGSRGEVLHWIGIAWSCMNVMERRIWKSSIRLETKLCLYQTYVSQFSCMGARHGPPQSTCTRLDAFDMWALCKILRILYTRHMSNVEVRGTTGCSPLFHLVTNRRLRLFRHTAHSSPRKDHHRAAAVAIRQVPPNWKRPIGRPIYLIKPIGSVQLRRTWAH